MRWISVEGERQALGCAAGLHELVQIHGMYTITAGLQEPGRTRASGRNHHLFPHTDGITGKSQRLVLGHDQAEGVRDSLCNRRLAIGVERRGK